MCYRVQNNICCFQILPQLVSRVIRDLENGLTYAMLLPVIVWHGTKDVLVDLSTKDIIPVFSG